MGSKPARIFSTVVALASSVFGCGESLDRTVPRRAGAPRLIEVALRAAPLEHEFVSGQSSRIAAYSGSLPGPLIRATRGDRLRVAFENGLDEPTTVHFHGIRVPNAMDGVPDMTQPPIPPGGRFDYEFDLPDAGLYWYHPHYDSLTALGSGLYGAILVDDPDEAPDLGDEAVLVLSDVSLDEHGVLVPPERSPEALFAGRPAGGNAGAFSTRLERATSSFTWEVPRYCRSAPTADTSSTRYSSRNR
jgi:FtsP/CotA-like multicopper oxidase with cupredoxin domain